MIIPEFVPTSTGSTVDSSAGEPGRAAHGGPAPRDPGRTVRGAARDVLEAHLARAEVPFVIIEGTVGIDTAGFLRSACAALRDRSIAHLDAVPVADHPDCTKPVELRLLDATSGADPLDLARRLITRTSEGAGALQTRPPLLVIEHADRLDATSLTVIDMLATSQRAGVVLLTARSTSARRFGRTLASDRGLHLVLEPLGPDEIAALTESVTGVPGSLPVSHHLHMMTAGVDVAVTAALRAGLEVGWLRRTNNWIVFNGVPVMLDEHHAVSYVRRLERECGSDHITLLDRIALLGDLAVDEAMHAGAQPDLVFEAAELGLVRIDAGRVHVSSRLLQQSLQLSSAVRESTEVQRDWWDRSSAQAHPRRSVFAAMRAGLSCTDAELLDGARNELEAGLPMRALALCTQLSREAVTRPQAIVCRALIAVFLGRRASALDILRSSDNPAPIVRRLTAEILVSDFGNVEAAMQVTDDPAAQRTLQLRADMLTLLPRAVLDRCADIVDGELIPGGDPAAAERLRLEIASVRAQCHAYLGEVDAAESLLEEILVSPVTVGPINRRRLGRGISCALLALGRNPGRLRSARWGRPSDGAMLDVSTRQLEHTIHLLTSGAPVDEFRTQVDQLQDILISPLSQPSWLTGVAEVLEIIGHGHLASALDDPLPVISSIEEMRAHSPIHGMLIVAARVIIAAPGRIGEELADAVELLTGHPGLARLVARTVALRRFAGLTPYSASRLADVLGAHGRDASLASVLLARATGDEDATQAAFAALVADPAAEIDPRGIAVLLTEAGLTDSPAARALVARHPAVEPLLALQEDIAPRPSATPDVLEKLTERERAVALETMRGGSNVVIAAALGISKRTVETHLRNIYRKLDVTSRQELYAELVA